MRQRTCMVSVAAATLALLGTAFAPAQAAPEEEVVGGLISPLSLAVDNDGTVYVSQNFAGMLTKVPPGGDAEVIYTASVPGTEVGAVSVSDGVVTFSTTTGGQEAPKGKVWRMDDSGTHRLANTFKYEKANNPDGDQTYGVLGISKKCRAKKPGKLRKYTGILESHPYATALGDDGVTYVADAAANDILSIADDGTVSTVATLPPTKIRISKKIQKAMKLPRCARHAVFRAEPVPTDVEQGPDGNLYVTSLPGGPEDPAMGAHGRVYKIAMPGGEVSKMADGLVSPTGLAISPTGTAYVAMLFASVIFQQPLNGSPGVFAQVDYPGGVEYSDGHVYATRTDLTNDGTSPPNGAVLRWSTAPTPAP